MMSVQNALKKIGVRGKYLFSFLHLHLGKKNKVISYIDCPIKSGNDKDGKPSDDKDIKFKPQIKKQPFKSSFSTWIRAVAFILVVVFVPEQAAQAVEYDWSVLWNRPAISPLNTLNPSYLKNIQNLHIPNAIKSILRDVSNKPITEIKISPEVSIKLEKPLKMSNRRIEEIYNWLIGKPCGAKALYDFLKYQGVEVSEQDISVLALTIDILNDVTKAEGNPEVIKSSLYSLAKTSEFFGHVLFPVKIASSPVAPRNDTFSHLSTPFIAHFKGDHYILVSRICEDKVYFVEEHKEDFLPIEKFESQFSGYALVSKDIPSTVIVSEDEAKKVLGAKSRKDTGVQAFGVLAGSLLMSGASVSGQSVMTGLRNYGITYAMPKVLKHFGLNESWQNIGGAFLSGSLIGGMNSVKSGRMRDWIKPVKWQMPAMIQSGASWSAIAAIQQYGYKKNWDNKIMGGASLFASEIGGAVVDYGFSKTLGGWSISDDFKSTKWLNKEEFKSYAGIEKPFQKKAFSLAGEFIDLSAQHIAERQWGWKRQDNYSRGLTAMSSQSAGSFGKQAFKAIHEGKGWGKLTGVLRAGAESYAFGVVSTGLQHITREITKDVTSLDPSVITVSMLGLSSALRGIAGDGGLELGKEIFKASIRQATGNFLSGGLAVLDDNGKLYYKAAPDSSFAANMIDFSRQTGNLPNSSWQKEDFDKFRKSGVRPQKESVIDILSTRFFQGFNSQTSSNLIGIIQDKY
ncbi:MAG: cysteine peptidase family C39 domain-containing protein, partial [Candidatus Omnitrophota bacterium]